MALRSIFTIILHRFSCIQPVCSMFATVMIAIPFAGLAADTPTIPQLLPGDIHTLTGAIDRGDFAAAWHSTRPDTVGEYILGLIASDPRCRPGSAIVAYRNAAMAAYDVENPAHFQFDFQRQQLSDLPQADVLALRDRLRKQVRDNTTNIEFNIIESSTMNLPRGFDPYPCYASNAASPSPKPPIPRVLANTPLQDYVCYDLKRRIMAEQSLVASRPHAGPNHSFFSSLRLIRVSFPQVPQNIRTGILHHALAALRLWYLSCSNCAPESSAIIAVDDKFWVIEPFIRTLEVATSLAPQNPRAIPQLGQAVGTTINETMRLVRIADLFGRQSRGDIKATDYVEVTSNDPAVRRLCNTADQLIDDRLVPLRTALCRAPAAVANYEITLSDDGRTDCGDSKTIACESKERIQFNTAAFKYVAFDGADSVVMGNGPTIVDLLRVMLHETGHWIGFDHAPDERRDDLMSPSYTSHMCLSDQNVMDMESLKFTGSQLSSPSALTYSSK
jgi:hypothetical protein